MSMLELAQALRDITTEQECCRCHRTHSTVADRQVNSVDVKNAGMIQHPGAGTVAQFAFSIPLCSHCYMNYTVAVLTHEMPFNARGLKAWIAGDTVKDNVTQIPSLASVAMGPNTKPPKRSA